MYSLYPTIVFFLLSFVYSPRDVTTNVDQDAVMTPSLIRHHHDKKTHKRSPQISSEQAAPFQKNMQLCPCMQDKET